MMQIHFFAVEAMMMQLQIFNPLVFVRKYKANMISAEHLLSLRYSCR